MGPLASLRRRWIARLGWYPGDWVWGALLTLVVAAAATAGAIVVAHHRDGAKRTYAVALAGIAVGTPSAPSAGTGTQALPTPPEPGGTPKKGRVAWPAGESGWTIVLVSYPKTIGEADAAATATRAAKNGLGEVGIIDSSRYASLQPGYYVVFTGIYSSKTDADAAVATARQAGFAGAYSRQIVG